MLWDTEDNVLGSACVSFYNLNETLFPFLPTYLSPFTCLFSSFFLPRLLPIYTCIFFLCPQTPTPGPPELLRSTHLITKALI